MRAPVWLLLAMATCIPEPVVVTGWQEVATMETARSEHPAVVVAGEIVVIGGLIESGLGRFSATHTVEAYAPATDTWRTLPQLPDPRHHAMAAVAGDRIFVIGGYSAAGFVPVDTVWELVGGRWVERSALPIATGAGAAVVIEEWIYVVGGLPHSGLLRYDPASDSWTELARPRQSREHVAAVALSGEVWAIGGRWQGLIHDTTEVYDPSTDTWRSGPLLKEARSGFGAAVVDGSIVVAGGEVFAPDRALASVERLDPESGEWVLIDPLPVGLHGNPLVAIGSDLYLPGGSTRAAGVENDGRTYVLGGG